MKQLTLLLTVLLCSHSALAMDEYTRMQRETICMSKITGDDYAKEETPEENHDRVNSEYYDFSKIVYRIVAKCMKNGGYENGKDVWGNPLNK